MAQRPPLTPLVQSLPATVPFVGPEAQERTPRQAVPRPHRRQREQFRPGAVGDRRHAGRGARHVDVLRPRQFRPEGGAGGASTASAGKTWWSARASTGCSSLVVRMFVAPGDAGGDLARRLPDLQLPRRRLRRAAGRRALPRTTARAWTACSTRRAGRRRRSSISPIPTIRWAPGGRRTRSPASSRRCPRRPCWCSTRPIARSGPASALPPIDASRPNVLRMRTFSKAYGLAGMRCGYAIGEAEVIARLREGPQPLRRQPHGAGGGRRGACRPGLSRPRSRARSRPGASASSDIARDNGLSPIASATNFVTIDCGSDGDFALKVMETPAGARRVHPQADGAGARPLHPRQRRARRGTRHLRRGTARRHQGRARRLGFLKAPVPRSGRRGPCRSCGAAPRPTSRKPARS